MGAAEQAGAAKQAAAESMADDGANSVVRTLVLSAIVLSVGGYCLSQAWSFTIDDAGISYAYAKHLADGDGLVAAVGGPTIEGYSNPLWVLLLSALHLVGAELTVAAKWLGAFLLFVGCAGLVQCMASAQGRCWRALSPVDILPALLVIGCTPFIVWMPGGLENSLYFALMTWAIALDLPSLGNGRGKPLGEKSGGARSEFWRSEVWRSELWRSVAVGGCLLGLCLTRPDGVLYAALHLGVTGLLRFWSRGAPRWRSWLSASAIVAFGYALFLLARRVVFGEWVPNTFYAKVAVTAKTAEQGWDYLLESADQAHLGWLLPLSLVGALTSGWMGLLCAAYLLGVVFFVVYSGGDWMPYGRFISFGIPLLALLAARGVSGVFAELGRRSLLPAWSERPKLGGNLLSVAVAAVVALAWLWLHEPRLSRLAEKASAGTSCHFCQRQADIAALKERQRQLRLPSATLLINDFGAPSWLSDERLHPIDFLGLCDRTLARLTPYRARKEAFVSESVRLRYAIFEGGVPPTFVYIPKNFWGKFDTSVEWRSQYFKLPLRWLGPHAVRGAYFGVARSNFVDYFPPLAAFDAVDVAGYRYLGVRAAGRASGEARRAEETSDGDSSGVSTSAPSSSALPSSALPSSALPSSALPSSALPSSALPSSALPTFAVRIDVHLVRHRPDAPRNPKLRVRLIGDSGEIAAMEQTLFPSDVIASKVGIGEPVVSRFWLDATNATESQLRFEVAFRAKGTWRKLSTGALKDVLTTRRLAPLPQVMPAIASAELRSELAPLPDLVERRFLQLGQSARDPQLAERLVQLGRRLEGESPSDAYLAYVGAAQADRRRLTELSEPLWRTRPKHMRHLLSLEQRLLREFYRSFEQREFDWLLDFYLTHGEIDKATYWVNVAADLASAWKTQLTDSGDPYQPRRHRPLAGVESDFEAGTDGWTIQRKALVQWAPERQLRPASFGYWGEHVLASWGQHQGKAKGHARSKPFPLEGRALSFLLAGSRRSAQVELLVDGKSVRRAKPRGGADFFTIWWDVAEFEGKLATIRVTDRSSQPKRRLAVDHFRLWN